MAEGGSTASAVSKEHATPTTNNTAALSTSASSSAFSTPSNSNSPMWLMQPFVNFAEVDLQEKVGHGSYGVVYKAIWRNRYIAVKEFGASAEQKAIETEVKQLSRVQHPNIIALYGISADQQSTYLIMEYAEGGSLHNFLHGKVKPPYSKSHAMSWARQCAEGVAYLHAMKPKPLIHRDLKPLNLLLTNKGRHLKICDFGTVADKSTWMTNNKGSAAWMAPEVFEGSKYTEKCDVFSWAIVLWEVLSRQQPFKEIDNTYSIMWKIHKGERPALIEKCPKRIQELMTSCWATAPDKRPSMQDVVDIMRELAASYPGGDEPLEYEFVNQQIIQPGDQTNANIASTESGGFGNILASNCTSVSSQTTAGTETTTTSDHLTNTSACSTPTNPVDSLKPKSNQTPTRWNVIPEEQQQQQEDGGGGHASQEGNPFCLTPSAESSKRYNTIRNAMMQMASVPMLPISLNVDPNAWDLPTANEQAYAACNPFSKSDGKERLTVTDAKPMMPQPLGGGGNSNLSNNNESDEDDSDNDGPDQSLHEILDAELQPEPPIPDNVQSQEIYEEHRRLAKEYLRVDTKLYYAQALKEKLLAQMDPVERQEKQELLKKMSEKEELLELYNNLKQQLEKIRSGGQQPSNATSSSSPATQSTQDDVDGIQNLSEAEDWVVVAPNEQNT